MAPLRRPRLPGRGGVPLHRRAPKGGHHPRRQQHLRHRRRGCAARASGRARGGRRRRPPRCVGGGRGRLREPARRPRGRRRRAAGLLRAAVGRLQGAAPHHVHRRAPPQRHRQGAQAAARRLSTVDRRALVGSLLGASAALSYGITVVIGRELAKAHLPPADALGLRFGIAGVALVVLLAIGRRPVLPAPGERLRVFLFGAVGYAVESAFFYAGLARGTAAAVTLLFYSYPAVVTVADLVLTRRRPAPQVVFALALAGGGAGVIAGGSGNVDISGTGIAFSLAAAASFAVYLLAGDRLLHRTDSMRIAAWTAVGASASLLTFAAISGEVRVPADRWWQLLIYGGSI